MRTAAANLFPENSDLLDDMTPRSFSFPFSLHQGTRKYHEIKSGVHTFDPRDEARANRKKEE